VSNRELLGTALFSVVLAPALIGGFRSLLLEPAAPRTALNALALETFSSGPYREVLRVSWLYDQDDRPPGRPAEASTRPESAWMSFARLKGCSAK
jgi:hypothetical protein